MKNAYFITGVQYKTPKKIDPMRVSHSISKNILDMIKDAYGADESTFVPIDISLQIVIKKSSLELELKMKMTQQIEK